MNNKLSITYFCSTLIDAQFQVAIYLLFFNTYGLWGLSFVFLAKYIFKNALYRYYHILFKKISIPSLFALLGLLFGGLISLESKFILLTMPINTSAHILN